MIAAAAVAAAGGGAAYGASVQEAFDAATAAYAAGRWNDAVTAFSSLEARLPPRGRNAAIVRVRKGVALGHLGHPGDAAAVLADALPQLPASDASLTIDRYEGQMALGLAEEQTFEPVAASAAYRAAEAISPDPAARLDALTSAARVEAYLDPTHAIAAIDQALPAAVGKKLEAQPRTIRGRALLNAGQFAAARAELERAVALLGGLTLKVGFADLAARSDLATAALLAGDKEAARKDLAYSNAGTLEDGFDRGANMEPPECGAATGLRPDDVAVVEFGIGSDGAVAYASPVYSSRPGPQVAAFARAVAGWSWAPARLAKIAPLFRAMTRLELRCSTAAERPSMATALDAAVRGWFAAQHRATIAATGVAATDLAAARRGLAAAGDAAGRAPFQFEIATSSAAPDAERRIAAAAWSSAVLAASPPPLVRAAALLAAASAAERTRTTPSAAVLKVLDDPAIAADAPALATLRLYLADGYLEHRSYAAATPLIAAVTADARLAPRDPLRAAALIRTSAIALAAGDVAAARAAFEASGLNETQCALADAKPAVVRRSAGEKDYPAEAVQWHISGWAVTELDINADGTTSNVRTTIAYPPFVFGPPTVKIEQRARFTQSYRPGGGPGCSGFRVTQGYRVL